MPHDKKKCGKKGHRKHTPIESEKQRGLFGAELRRRREGKKPRMPGITTEELEEHLREAKGKKLPEKAAEGAVVQPLLYTGCWRDLGPYRDLAAGYDEVLGRS